MTNSVANWSITGADELPVENPHGASDFLQSDVPPGPHCANGLPPHAMLAGSTKLQ